MNNIRRKQIEKGTQKIAKAQEMLSDIVAYYEEIASDEQEAYDNMPESLQDTERGEAMEAAMEALESLTEALSNAMENLDEALGYAEAAME